RPPHRGAWGKMGWDGSPTRPPRGASSRWRPRGPPARFRGDVGQSGRSRGNPPGTFPRVGRPREGTIQVRQPLLDIRAVLAEPKPSVPLGAVPRPELAPAALGHGTQRRRTRTIHGPSPR